MSLPRGALPLGRSPTAACGCVACSVAGSTCGPGTCGVPAPSTRSPTFSPSLYVFDLLLPVASLKQRDAFTTDGAATWWAAGFTLQAGCWPRYSSPASAVCSNATEAIRSEAGKSPGWSQTSPMLIRGPCLTPPRRSAVVSVRAPRRRAWRPTCPGVEVSEPHIYPPIIRVGRIRGDCLTSSRSGINHTRALKASLASSAIPSCRDG